jgi:hypothetical protein
MQGKPGWPIAICELPIANCRLLFLRFFLALLPVIGYNKTARKRARPVQQTPNVP